MTGLRTRSTCSNTTSLLRQISFFAVLAALPAFMPPQASAQDEKGAGAVLSAQASAKDVGLPLYPGSKPHKDKDEDSTSANLGLWGGGSGFKLAVVKMESGDAPERLATFYKKALAKYGKVLDCSNPPPAKSDTENSDSSKTLTCENDKAESGGYLFKSGTKEKQHVAAIQPSGHGSLYQLVYVGAWGKDSK